jgi:hypothetical protein
MQTDRQRQLSEDIKNSGEILAAVVRSTPTRKLPPSYRPFLRYNFTQVAPTVRAARPVLSKDLLMICESPEHSSAYADSLVSASRV